MSKTSFKNFLKLKPMRKAHVDQASSAPKPYSFEGNELAKINHPKAQHVVITKVEDVAENMRRYTFAPDFENGTERLAPFTSGQYISVKYQVDDIRTTRPYSLCSANGEYQIAIKKDPNGLTSTYAFDNWKIGTKVELSAPEGWFVYEPVRDCKDVVAIAGGSGITPFLSMAKEIANGKLKCNLTLIYGARNIANIAFKDEFDAMAKSCPNFKVVYVLSDEKADGYLHGFITKDIIEANTPVKGDTSFFVCGPKAMYDAVLKDVRELGIDRRHIRCEVFGEAHDIKEFSDCPQNVQKDVEITVKIQDKIFKVLADTSKTIMRNLEEAGIAVLSKCRSGVCGFCHSSLVKGSVFIPKVMDALRQADRIYNQVHLCSAFALSDITIIVAKA
ncbi:MAG: iron-sulfur cluster-binding domain-containing protein [Bacilli bacterium]|nr:iron-sulfur cluster-binding domain-containing protein [Bacilli bacterium]